MTTIPLLLLCISLMSLMFSGTDADANVTKWLEPGTVFEFDGKESPHIGLLNRLHWTEKNERSTSRNYTFWEEADVYLLEWPGNITRFDQNQPLVKWARKRAKYLEDPCGLEYTGIEMRVYAYNYVYLTWGPNRLTKTYTMPLTVPKSVVSPTTLARLSDQYSYEENGLNTILVYDLAFTFDTLLLAYSDGVIRVSGLEMAYAEVSKVSSRPLKYSKSRGIRGPIDRIIVQNCCLKTEFCNFGNFAVAYSEHPLSNAIYTSYDGGMNFQLIKSQQPQLGSLQVVLSYPELGHLLLFRQKSDTVIMHRIGLIGNDQTLEPEVTLFVKGNLQGSRLGMESSFVIWDNCSVWYSADVGLKLTQSLFYINKRIRTEDNDNRLHLITSEHCSFDENSVLAYGESGKFVLMDGRNRVFMGIDGKSNVSQLVALQVDMSLLIPGKELSVTPVIDTMSDQPKLIYPPKYLELPKTFNLGKSYERRLGMRVLPKNVYPSDYITAFYDVNVRDQVAKSTFSLKPCQTSTLQVNNSITQKRKLYHASLSSILNFTIVFTSRTRKLRQLTFEPDTVLKHLSVKVTPQSIDTLGVTNVRYFLKYRILIQPKPTANLGDLLRINFYTKQDLRCNYLPRVPVYVKLSDKPSPADNILSDDDMSRSVYLKSVTAGETKYLHKGKQMKERMGETFKVDTCPFSKQS